MNEKVVISGAGLVSSLGTSASETWAAILAGKSGTGTIDNFDVQGFDCPVAAQVHGLGPSELGIHPRDSRIMDTHSYMLMKSSRDAFVQSQLDKGSIAPEDIGYFAGMGMVDYNIKDLLPAVLQSLDDTGNLDYNRFYADAYQQIHPLWPLSMLNNINFCQVAIDLGIKGENTTFSPHADSGIHAIIEAYHAVMEDTVKVVLAGGVSEKVSPLSMARALWFGILDISDKGNEVTCRPFSKDRQGTVLGEGSGIISLEKESHAQQRAAEPLAAITGYGTSYELSTEAPCPSAKAISRSMEQAIAGANIKPSHIDVIIAHGDGTLMGDQNEIQAIHQTFTDHAETVYIFSSKAALGHMLAGAAAVDVVLGIYILRNGIIPAVYSYPLQDNQSKINLVSGKPITASPRRILINSQSYEGQCASLILESAKEQ